MALVECPKCGWNISDKATRCPKCELNIISEVVRCYRCGRLNLKENDRCAYCSNNSCVKQEKEKEIILDNKKINYTKTHISFVNNDSDELINDYIFNMKNK